jgi:hypothetical protein
MYSSDIDWYSEMEQLLFYASKIMNIILVFISW